MGLDMHLDARFHLSEYDSNKKAFEKLSKLKLPGVTIPEPYLDNYTWRAIEVPIMYWRKANAIHLWFVTNVQDGKDECQTSYVDTEKIRELDKLVSEVFMSKCEKVALERLPPTDGFFFGSTDIDEWFWEEMRTTMDATHKLLADIDAGKLNGWEFYYHASW